MIDSGLEILIYTGDDKPVPLKITDGSFDLPFTKDKSD